jgi:hypothetical protein
MSLRERKNDRRIDRREGKVGSTVSHCGELALEEEWSCCKTAYVMMMMMMMMIIKGI